LLPAFTCGQFAQCNQYDGQCKCPPGWSGIDCLTPRMWLKAHSQVFALTLNTECDSLAEGEHRRPRDGNTPCECKDGWGGVNCNGTFCNYHQF